MAYEGGAFYDDAAVFENYAALRRRPGNANDTLELPIVRDLLGNVAGADVLDLGCGDGGFGLQLLAAGAASYLAVDGSANMIAAARARLAGVASASVVQSDLMAWSFPPARFHTVTARLCLHYVADLEKLLALVKRSLCPAGHFVFSVEHPVITAFEMDDAGPLDAGGCQVDDYFVSGPRVTHWLGAEVVKHHRTFEDYFMQLQAAGWVVEQVRESKPVRSRYASEEAYRRALRVPLFLFMRCR